MKTTSVLNMEGWSLVPILILISENAVYCQPIPTQKTQRDYLHMGEESKNVEVMAADPRTKNLPKCVE
jgi:hypothetical protein